MKLLKQNEEYSQKSHTAKDNLGYPPCPHIFYFSMKTWVVLRAFREGEVLRQFQDFREKFWSKFWISLCILYIFTSPSAQDREKSARLGRLFLPNRPLGWPILELSEREKFNDNFRISGRSFSPNFRFLYILCIFILPQLKIGRSQPD